MNEPIKQFKEAMYSAGMTPPDFIEADGKLRRFASGDKKNDKSGWYVFHNEGIPAGAFGRGRHHRLCRLALGPHCRGLHAGVERVLA